MTAGQPPTATDVIAIGGTVTCRAARIMRYAYQWTPELRKACPTMSLPDHPSPAPSPLETFEQLCHDVSNPLMIIGGHAYLLSKAIRRLPHLSSRERQYLLAELAHITLEVEAMAALLDAHREALVDSLEDG